MRSRAAGAMAALIFAALPAVSADFRINHDKLTCLPPGANAKITAQIPPAEAVASVRAYFRGRDAADEHYVEMLRGDGGSYWGVLPVASLQGGPFTYRIVARNAAGRQVSTETIKTAIQSPCPVKLTDEETRIARNLVVGQSKPNLPDVPLGFECFGIAGRIGADGELRAINPCPMSVARASSSARMGAPSGLKASSVAATGAPCDGCTPEGGLAPGGRGGSSVVPCVVVSPVPGQGSGSGSGAGTGPAAQGGGASGTSGAPCDGCTPEGGALTPGGRGGVTVGPCVVPPQPTPPPVSPSRPRPEEPRN